MFLDPEVTFSSHTMFFNDSTKEFTLINNPMPSYNIAFEHYNTRWLPMFTEILTIFLKTWRHIPF